MTIVISTEDSVRFQTLAGLKDSISARLDRTFDNNDLTDFIYLAEREMERVLPVAAREVTTALTINSQTSALPIDFKAVRHITVGSGAPLSLGAPAVVANDQRTGCPVSYAIIAQQIWFSPVPAGTQSGTLIYERKISTLTESSPSNWVLDKHPDAYFYGALVQAADFIEDPTKIGRYRTMFETVLQQIVEESERYRNSGSPMQPTMIGVV